MSEIVFQDELLISLLLLVVSKEYDCAAFRQIVLVEGKRCYCFLPNLTNDPYDRC